MGPQCYEGRNSRVNQSYEQAGLFDNVRVEISKTNSLHIVDSVVNLD